MISFLIAVLVLVIFLAIAYMIVVKFITDPFIQQIALLIIGLIGLLVLVSWFYSGGVPFSLDRPMPR